MLLKKENGWKKEGLEKAKIFEFCEEYKRSLDFGKTEREYVKYGLELAKKEGFVCASKKESLKAGDKVFYVNREKNLVLVVIGKEDITKGINYVVSHIDSPRIDLKQNPLYEELELAYMKTHYYGGIKKYQWASIPLSLHGVVILSNGEKKDIVIGEKDDDPVFTIPDLLPHLAAKYQGDRQTSEVIKGEELHIIVGSMPTSIKNAEVKELIKYKILEELNETYGMIEEDFISAEFQLVPAFKAKDIGLDRSLIGAYGQDDRVCGYTSLKAILDINGIPEKTAVCFLADKEETGSHGSTGLQSNYLEYFTSDLISKIKKEYTDLDLRKTLWNSNALSSDVNAAVDPIFKGVHEVQNAAKLNYGIVVTKFTGARGKSGTNDADAEYVWSIRNLLNSNNITWQIGELGRVDEGGGGTVAMFLAQVGIKTIDVGPALLAMHSPFEVSSKLDVYETYKTYRVFFEKMI
ncbi:MULTISPECIES: aminopeptidase [Cetobacterium]|jgi:aspartyl aminopeptidase|uniref:M18 family aminopeptidase n=1 Tax=Candidatus Cetobacterium colombiensis TaxID=3073100 RepID=A0ABU4W903_9FUSO|nr:aminopeptidase [Candidatus Cetobacterium colombiensis]MDX8335076.1 aminopeptidase [Candidatus Cetobacterium colombiensis]